MRILVFGDSITRGRWDTEGGWVERLRRHYDLLQTADLQNRDDPSIINLGVSGNNSRDVLNRIAPEIIARTTRGNLPIIMIQIGINDSSTSNPPEKETPALPIDKYEQNLRLIVNKIRPLCRKIIFVGLSACDEVLTTPAFWGNFHYTNDAIKRYEDKMKEVAADNNIAFVPVFDRFKAELDKGNHLLSDGLHPNNDGHVFMSEIILKDLESVIKN